MIKSVIALFMILFSTSLLAQRASIIKIHDTNLFELDDSTLVKLAGVETPSINNPDSSLNSITKEIINYANKSFPYGLVHIEYTGNTTPDSLCSYVYMARGNLFYKVSFNEIYLKRGYGRFINNVDSVHENIYSKLESGARKNNVGIWGYRWQCDNVLLDYSNYSPGLKFIKIAPEYIYDRSAWRIILGLTGGPVIGGLSVIVVGLSFAGYGEASSGDGLGPGMTGGIIGYIAGSSLAVYLAAKGGNKDLSLWETIASGFIGTAIGGGIAYLIQGSDYEWIPIAAGVSLGPIIYVNLFAPPPSRDEEVPLPLGRYRISIDTHKDFYNSTLILQQELFRINF